jgi:hypothetical protein
MIKFAEHTLTTQITKFFSGNKTRRTLVYPTAFTHIGPALAFNGEVGSLVLPLKAQRGKSFQNPNIPMVEIAPLYPITVFLTCRNMRGLTSWASLGIPSFTTYLCSYSAS